jgi:cytochrome c biogenesis factor
MSETYKKHATKIIRLKAKAFALVSIILLSIVIIDSFRIELPFYYILFFILGLIISVILNQFSSVSWDNVNNKITEDLSVIVLVLLAIYTLFEYFIFPTMMQNLHITYIKAATLLTSSGLYYGRIMFMWKRIRTLLFTDKQIKKIFKSTSNE